MSGTMFSRTFGRSSFFFLNYPATTEIYTLSLHDALPIYIAGALHDAVESREGSFTHRRDGYTADGIDVRSEEHTSELQSRGHLVCRLLLEKKNILITHTQRSCSTPSLSIQSQRFVKTATA